MPSALTSMGKQPAVWAASTSMPAPPACAARAMSTTGCTAFQAAQWTRDGVVFSRRGHDMVARLQETEQGQIQRICGAEREAHPFGVNSPDEGGHGPARLGHHPVSQLSAAMSPRPGFAPTWRMNPSMAAYTASGLG